MFPSLKEQISLSFKEIAEQHSVSETTVWQWARRGVTIGGVPVYLKAYRIGRSWRVTPAALEEFLRLCNPDTWEEAAQAQEQDRKRAEKDRKVLRRMLEGA